MLYVLIGGIVYATTPLPATAQILQISPLAEIVLQTISFCESGNRNFEDGKIIVSETDDYGKFQINKIHIPTAEKMKLDIMSESGNYEYAKFLLLNEGVKPWKSSSKCWLPLILRFGRLGNI